MKFAHLISRFVGSEWLIRDESLDALARVLEHRSQPLVALAQPVLPAPASAAPAVSPLVAALAQRGIALVEVSGVLGKRLDAMESLCGGCDYDAVLTEVEEVAADPALRAIVIRFDSPGGTVVGCAEAAERLGAIVKASSKPIVAYTETECCSAAYWMAAACRAIYATPSAIVGSTGAKMVLRDESARHAAEGVKFHVFKSGTMKDIGASYRAPTEQESQRLQARTDAIAAKFRASVLSTRPGVAPEAFETAMFYSGDEAQALGLIDEQVLHLLDLVAQI